jgi:hypothetical protein
MQFYNIDTKFAFGKYSGKTMREILEIQPSYIEWCVINLDHFCISESVIDEIKSIKPNFVLSNEGQQKLADKYEIWENARSKKYRNNDYYYDDSDDWERDTFDALTDGMYGSYDDYEDGMGINSIMTFIGRD